MPTVRSLSTAFEQGYLDMLTDVAATRIRPPATSLFWPKAGRSFDGELMLIGRAVNGWIDRWNTDEPADLADLCRAARRTAEDRVNGCPMGWVLSRWKRGDGDYDTARSQFWVAAREVALMEHPEWERDWPSHLAWSNLAKVSRWTKGNPSWRLRQAQLPAAIELLRREVEELAPRRILIFAGRDWFAPYAAAMGLDMEWRDGLVEGVSADRRWVVAVHPMTRSPHAVAKAAAAAFAEVLP
jgi:hypothetical protein